MYTVQEMLRRNAVHDRVRNNVMLDPNFIDGVPSGFPLYPIFVDFGNCVINATRNMVNSFGQPDQVSRALLPSRVSLTNYRGIARSE